MYTVEQKNAIENHVFNKIHKESLKEKLNFSGGSDQELGYLLLQIAKENKDEFAVILGVGYVFLEGADVSHSVWELISEIYFDEWHAEHENIISSLAKLEGCNCVDFFYKAIYFIPEYLEYDENRALTRRIFFALGKHINCLGVKETLLKFLNCEDELWRSFAKEQLEIYMT
ncbi:hypothetical protein [Acinetobacter haemolyticus]|uniref:HEAT repeat domain-containing protein n=1 Tax=Acinetobacter haemolyticus TaxID=29430 RepID=A0AAW4J6D1_ACIHA|nr:hypothetical protein [Acinetobacter haemolyticus]MBO3658441.1 hypothetical protein [Acinetobacter haemolyticus]